MKEEEGEEERVSYFSITLVTGAEIGGYLQCKRDKLRVMLEVVRRVQGASVVKTGRHLPHKRARTGGSPHRAPRCGNMRLKKGVRASVVVDVVVLIVVIGEIK